jgi:hypothetical protein
MRRLSGSRCTPRRITPLVRSDAAAKKHSAICQSLIELAPGRWTHRDEKLESALPNPPKITFGEVIAQHKTNGAVRA